MSHIAAVLGLEYHYPIMKKLWGHEDRTNRQTDLRLFMRSSLVTNYTNIITYHMGVNVGVNYIDNGYRKDTFKIYTK